MNNHPTKVETALFLSGWKEIAHYLGKGVRTVQRYERHLGLPVRRPAGKPRGSVVAVKAELDGWVKASPIREAFQLRNRPSAPPSPASAIKAGVSELAHLRGQMLTLRAELHTSLQQLQESIMELTTKLQANMLHASSIPSGDEFSLIERNALRVVSDTLKLSKAS